jgi:hypothetical protein
MKISEEFGPQIDPEDGTCGEILLVRRYVMVYGDYGMIWGRRCGTRTFARLEDAQARIAMIKEVNASHLVPKDLRVRVWWCWPGHYDPATPCPDEVQSKINKTTMYIAMVWSMTLEADKESSTAAAVERLNGKRIELEGQVRAAVKASAQEAEDAAIAEAVKSLKLMPDIADRRFKGRAVFAMSSEAVDAEGMFWGGRNVTTRRNYTIV